MDEDETPDAEAAADNDALEALLEFIRDARGFDFTGYKRSSLSRRIRKRMAVLGIEHWGEYQDRLEIDADEFQSLFNTILINVTGFFRDAEAWTYLQEEVVPEIVARRDADDEIRIWSAGCSTGQEAYSLAILLAEELGPEVAAQRVKIYGTDVDDEALQAARAGTYSAKALSPLSSELRDRYFESDHGGYTFRADLRRRVIFGRHDLTRDAPISRLDLLVCRNTLMYFNIEAQRHILDRLHFALRDGGVLFLGKAEMLLTGSDRFSAIGMRQRLFRRQPGRRAAPPTGPARVEHGPAPESRSTARRRQLREQLIDAAPYAALGLDSDGVIAAASAEARAQYGIGVHDIGRPFRDHELSYRPAELRSVVEQAHREHRTIQLRSVERHGPTSPDTQYLDIVVRPLTGSDGLPIGTSITFVDVTAQTRLELEIKRVHEDLETAYEELQSSNEELETTNEELQSSIEELETTNEELQSTNEELETTNEELQSGNEELEAMGEEMRIRFSELEATREFLDSVLSSLTTAVVVIDPELRVQTWNRHAEELWGLRLGEVDQQPFFDLDFGLPVDRVKDLVERCMTQRKRTGVRSLAAVNRRGRSIEVTISASPLDGPMGGVVLLIEEIGPPDDADGA
jgi:two-component system CheB/CheR fusion protein